MLQHLLGCATAIGLLMGFHSLALARLVSLGSNTSSLGGIRVVSENAREIVLEYEFNEIAVDSIERESGWRVRAAIESAGLTSDPGYPELPQNTAWIEVAGEEVELELLDLSSSTYRWGIPDCAPIPTSRTRSVQPQRVEDEYFLTSTDVFPSLAAEVVTEGSSGSRRLALVVFHPVQFDAGTEEWRVHRKMRVRLNIGAGRTLDEETRSGSLHRDPMARLILNPRDMPPPAETARPRMLIIAVDNLLTQLQEFVDWKGEAGIHCHLVPASTLPSSATDIREFVRTFSAELEYPLEFLLLVGDVDALPAFFGVGGSLTDHPYSLLTDEDYLPDLSVGRLPFNTAAQCSDWVDRLLQYERNGTVSNPLHATVFSSSSGLDPLHGAQLGDLFESLGIPVTRLQEPQTGSLSQLVNSLNSSPNWAFYIGHGHAQGWTSVHPAFGIAQVNSLDTLNQSVVIAVACATADLDFPTGSLAESWVNRLSSTGPLTYFGATESTAFYYSDTLGMAALQSLMTIENLTVGEASDFGRMACAAAFPQPPGGLTEETIEQFVLLGDPSLRIFTSQPRTPFVVVPSSIPIDLDQLTVTAEASGQPLEGATVCLSGRPPGFYAVTTTSAAGVANFALQLDAPQDLSLVVTGPNLRPHRSLIHVVGIAGPYLQALPIQFVDSAGDLDGNADRGEGGNLRFRVVNYGSLPSVPATMRVTTHSSLMTLDTGFVSLPAIEPGDTALVPGELGFSVSMAAEEGDQVLTSVEIGADGSSLQVQNQSVALHAPLFTAPVYYLTEDSGDGDANCEAGERLRLHMRFYNSGADAARGIQVGVQENSQHVTLVNSLDSIALCNPADSVHAEFVLQTQTTLQRGEPWNFNFWFAASNVELTSGSGSVRIGLIPVYLYVLDSAPSQVDALEGSLASLGVEFQRGTELPSQLSAYASIWIFSGIFPNQGSLPMEDAVRISSYLETGGCCYWEGGDVWAFDMETPLHDYFRIEGVQDGTSDAGPVAGEYGSRYEEYRFPYNGENSFIDQIEPESGAIVMLRNARQGRAYPVTIAYAAPAYRTVGTSIELGSLVDGDYPSRRVNIIADVLDWFRIPISRDITAPVILHVPISEWSPPLSPIRLHADVQDANDIAAVAVHYTVNSEPESELPLTYLNGRYRAQLPPLAAGATVSYRLSARDNAPLHNESMTPEYTFGIVENSAVPLSFLSGDGSDEPTMETIVVEKAGDASWSLTESLSGSRVLELHGNAGSPISLVSPVFSTSLLSGIRLKLWHFLRTEISPGGAACILVSFDGGERFSDTVWSADGESPVLESGTLIIDHLDAWASHDSVCLKFVYTGGWYWRLRDIVVEGQTRPSTRPVRGLTIRPIGDQMTLRWRSTPNAHYYVISASKSESVQSGFQKFAVTSDTVFVDHEANAFSSRFYAVDAVMEEGRVTLPEASRTTSARRSTRDERWEMKLHRTR